MLMNVWFDLKYAWRLTIKTPGHMLLCAIVIGLSVGLGVWACEAVYSTLFKPLPFPSSDRWYSVQIGADTTVEPEPVVDAYTYQELVKRKRTVHFLGAYAGRPAVLSEGHASTSLRAAVITPELLSAMGSAPQLGRLFGTADAQAGAAPAVILSFATWQRYFSGDRQIIGKQVRVDGRQVHVIGVMPEEFFAFQDFELWFALQPLSLAKPGVSPLQLTPIILLEEGQSAEAALGEMKPVIDDVNHQYPGVFKAGRHVELFPAHLMLTHDQVPFVAMISFVAVAILLLGCVNVGMLFYARFLERSRELALRVALGSSRARLMRQSVLESVLVVIVGLLLGVGLAGLGIRWGQSISDFTTPILGSGRSADYPQLHGVDLVIAVLAAVAIWLLSTLIPAWRIAKQDASRELAGSGKGTGSTGKSRSVIVLVAFQVILSCLVLVICANLMVAVKEEANKPTGVNTAGIMVSTYPTVMEGRYSEPTARLRYWDELGSVVGARIPGAEVAYSTSVPTRPGTIAAAIEHQEGATNQGGLKLPMMVVSNNYFSLLGLQRRSGRMFDATDTGSSLNVAVIDERTAQRYWPGQDVLGKRIQLNPTEAGPWLTIVGVVSAVAAEPYGTTVGVVYRPLRQAVPDNFEIVVRLPNASPDSRALLRSAAYEVDQALPLHNLQVLDEYLNALDVAYKSIVPLFSVISAITVILAATGLFGLISRSVAQRTQEVGVRRALGGTQWQVTAVFMRQGLIYLAIGLVGGTIGILATNVLSSSIPNILAHVGTITAAVFVLMAVVIFTSAYLPTRRAVALDPGDALRYE
jgi:putative ABC transport system permease protein